MNDTTTQSPCLAILPFRNLSSATDNDYFSIGFIMDLTTELCRFANLQVISPTTALALSTTGGDIHEAADKLGIDYTLSGGIRRRGDTLRINTELTEIKSQQVIWAERYEMPTAAIFDLQDDIISQVTSTLSVSIENSRLRALRHKPASDIAAYDYWLKGFAALQQGSITSDEQARGFFQQALDIDSHYARAYAGLSLSYFNEWSCQHWEKWDENEEQAYQYALLASRLDENDPLPQLVLGKILLYRREYERSESYLECALQLNPNDTHCLIQIAMCFAYLGRREEAMTLVEKVFRLNPHCEAWYYAFAALPYFLGQCHHRALDLVARAEGVSFVDIPAYVACAHMACGDTHEARRFLEQFKLNFREKIIYGRQPEEGETLRWFLHVNPFRKQEDIALLTDYLVKAGLDAPTTEPRSVTVFAADTSTTPVFQSEGDTWRIGYQGKTVHLKRVKGFFDIARMLTKPDHEFHCSDLMGLPITDSEDTAIDAQARATYKQRILELQEELEEAEELNDIGRAELLREELDQLIDHLAQATGLGGKSRKLSAPSDKARAAVTWRIRHAILKMESAHPELGRHLQNSIKTGIYCSYSPETTIRWRT